MNYRRPPNQRPPNRLNNRNRGGRTRTIKQINKNTVPQVLGVIPIQDNPKSTRTRIQPQHDHWKGRFESEVVTLTSSGNAYAVKSFLATAGYDIDPSLLSSSMSGFYQRMELYYNYQALQSKVSVDFTNNEDFSVRCCLGFFSEDPGQIATNLQNTIDAGEQSQVTPWSSISAKGGQDRTRLRMRCNYAEFIGNPMYYYGSEYFFGTPGSNPITNIYLGIFIWAKSNFTSAGVDVNITLDTTFKLFYRRVVLDSGPIYRARSELVNKLRTAKKTMDIQCDLLVADDEKRKIFSDLKKRLDTALVLTRISRPGSLEIDITNSQINDLVVEFSKLLQVLQ